MGQLLKPYQIVPVIACLLSSVSGIITAVMIYYNQNIIGAVPE